MTALVFTARVRDDEAVAALRVLSDALQGDTLRQTIATLLVQRTIERRFRLKYPEATGAPMADMWTARQRRWFFWALREGRITVPYRRTNALRDSMKVEAVNVGKTNASVTLSFPQRGRFNPRWVIGERREQSRYFARRTRWQPLSVQLGQRQQELEAVVQDAVNEVLGDMNIGE